MKFDENQELYYFRFNQTANNVYTYIKQQKMHSYVIAQYKPAFKIITFFDYE